MRRPRNPLLENLTDLIEAPLHLGGASSHRLAEAVHGVRARWSGAFRNGDEPQAESTAAGRTFLVRCGEKEVRLPSLECPRCHLNVFKARELLGAEELCPRCNSRLRTRPGSVSPLTLPNDAKAGAGLEKSARNRMTETGDAA
jgi:hypothetical protein